VTRRRSVGLFVSAAAVLALASGTAQAATQTRADPSDAPNGASGKADLRAVTWDISGSSATLTVAVDESTYGGVNRAEIGVHVLMDTDADGIADYEIVATRNVDGVHVDLVLDVLDRALSTADCQDLAGHATAAQGTVPTTIASGIETFAFSFDPTTVPGGLSAFRWAAFGQAPAVGAPTPWDVMPDAADPAPATANPGDRRCASGHSGLSVRMGQGVAFPDAVVVDPDPEPVPVPVPVADPDTDVDGIADARDSCPLAAGSAANGCPDIVRTLTLDFKAATERLRGVLGPAGPCAAARKVSVFRVKPGPDRKVGTATTRPSGGFKLADDAAAGKYYAGAQDETIAGVGNCQSVKSKKIVVGES
jgi:hypothetical protein